MLIPCDKILYHFLHILFTIEGKLMRHYLEQFESMLVNTKGNSRVDKEKGIEGRLVDGDFLL